MLVLALSPLGKIVNLISQLYLPYPINVFILKHLFCRIYPVNLKEIKQPLKNYHSLISFFTREISPGCRTIADSPFVFPCDGILGVAGEVEKFSANQIKGSSYSIVEFLNKKKNDNLLAELNGGIFVNIYLAPYHYHRVHFPCDARLLQIKSIPGRLLPVNQNSISNFKDLYVKNKRTVFIFDWGVMVMVGALNVGKITTSYPEQLEKNEIPVKKAEEAGIFHLGSTVVLLIKKSQAKMCVSDIFSQQGKSIYLGQPL